MGEVYRARDTRLKREVAIKVLPEAFSHDPDRLARFQREAELLATLNHPNIAAVYGLEQADRVSAIVLELVEGETLAELLDGSGPLALGSRPVAGQSPQPKAKSQRALPLDEALAIARQIADALDAAHEKGVIHRDLKPANVKVTPEGQVKVLDFGLAKLLDTQPAAASLSMSPTLSVQATHAGVILGTAAYMSPEQARGKPVDKRTDVWAFGCVLFELLTGTRAFAGEEISDVLARILEREPDFTALPATTPPAIRRLLRRSPEKDRKRRLPDIAVARLEIDEALGTPHVDSSPTAPGTSRTRERIAWSAAVVVLAASAAALSVRLLREPWQSPRPRCAPRSPHPPPPIRCPSRFPQTGGNWCLWPPATAPHASGCGHWRRRHRSRWRERKGPLIRSGRPTAGRWASLPMAS